MVRAEDKSARRAASISPPLNHENQSGRQQMFKVLKNRVLWWPVIWEMPVDGGKTETAKFEAQFRLVDLGELRTLLFDIEQAENSDTDYIDRCREIVSRFTLNWRGIADADGKEMEFSAANLTGLLSIPIVFSAILAAYRNCLAGVPAAQTD